MTVGMLHGETIGSLFEIYGSPEQVQWDADSQTAINGNSIGWIEIENVEGGSATGID